MKLSDHLRTALDQISRIREALDHEETPVLREVIRLELTEAEIALRRALHLVTG